MELARGLPPDRQVLADSLEEATAAQMAFMETWMREETASRGRSKRARLLRQAGFPQSKELDGYDWTPVRFPVDCGRESLESLEFTGRHEDVVLFGPPGTGKTVFRQVGVSCWSRIPTAVPTDHFNLTKHIHLYTDGAFQGYPHGNLRVQEHSKGFPHPFRTS